MLLPLTLSLERTSLGSSRGPDRGPQVLLALTALGSGGVAAVVLKTVRDPLWDSTHVSNPTSTPYVTPSYPLLVSTYLRWHATSLLLLRKCTCFTGPSLQEEVYIDATLFLILACISRGEAIPLTNSPFQFLVCPRNGVFLVPYILMSHCYLNSILSVVVLNVGHNHNTTNYNVSNSTNDGQGERDPHEKIEATKNIIESFLPVDSRCRTDDILAITLPAVKENETTQQAGHLMTSSNATFHDKVFNSLVNVKALLSLAGPDAPPATYLKYQRETNCTAESSGWTNWPDNGVSMSSHQTLDAPFVGAVFKMISTLLNTTISILKKNQDAGATDEEPSWANNFSQVTSSIVEALVFVNHSSGLLLPEELQQNALMPHLPSDAALVLQTPTCCFYQSPMPMNHKKVVAAHAYRAAQWSAPTAKHHRNSTSTLRATPRQTHPSMSVVILGVSVVIAFNCGHVGHTFDVNVALLVYQKSQECSCNFKPVIPSNAFLVEIQQLLVIQSAVSPFKLSIQCHRLETDSRLWCSAIREMELELPLQLRSSLEVAVSLDLIHIHAYVSAARCGLYSVADDESFIHPGATVTLVDKDGHSGKLVKESGTPWPDEELWNLLPSKKFIIRALGSETALVHWK
ncbi:hypothetical protein BDR03DRAFT_987676 [Suillus americanus]|nr:hypothetical protein BDR03DRAFT_987676 [Suillus americanus]